MVNPKAKGTRGERGLVKFFNDAGWACIRAPGSGSSTYPSPDILAGNAVRRVAIECKVTKENKKYFDKAKIAQLQEFSQKFGAESWVGIKFNREPWYFLLLEDLENTGNCWAVSVERAKRKGLQVQELVGMGAVELCRKV